MELDIAKYKEQVESLTRELNSEKAKSHKSSVTVLKKIARIKDVLTKQMDEVSASAISEKNIGPVMNVPFQE